MRLLLDTHAYLWWLLDHPTLTPDARDAIAAGEHLVFVSAASIWEAAIKSALGRLDTSDADLVSEIEANGFEELPIHARHAGAAGTLEAHHDDPFDRMLVAQAQIEQLTIVTRDRAFAPYDVATLPA